MSDQTYRPVDQMTFKEASQELELIVRALEAGDLELEDSLARYARGVELLRELRTRLASAEQQVRVLLDATDETAPVTDTASAPSVAYVNEPYPGDGTSF